MLSKFDDPRWQRFRLKVFEFYGYTCRRCGLKGHEKQFQAHHLEYFNNRDPWQYMMKEMRCLCYRCHSEVSRGEKKVRRELADLPYLNGLTPDRIMEAVFEIIKCELSNPNNYVQADRDADDEVIEEE